MLVIFTVVIFEYINFSMLHISTHNVNARSGTRALGGGGEVLVVRAEQRPRRRRTRCGEVAGPAAPGAPIMRRTRHAERAVGVAAVGAQHATLVQGQCSSTNFVIMIPYEG